MDSHYNSLIEEEFSAQDIVDIVRDFYVFVNMVLDKIPYDSNKSLLENSYISDYILFTIDNDILEEMKPEKYKEAIEELVEKHRKDIIDLAKKLLEKVTKDDAEFTKNLEEKGFSKSDIEAEKLRKERLKQEETEEKGYGRYITSNIRVASFKQNYTIIGKNKLKMILDGRICRSKEQCKEMYEEDLL